MPGDVLLFDSDRGGNHEIFRMQADGTGASALTVDARYENWWPRPSPDRKRILFYRTPKGLSEHYDKASLWMMNADGSASCELRPAQTDAWALQGHAEWSPDGTQLAMFGGIGASAEIYLTGLDGKVTRQVTHRGGVNTDVSWSPDGSTLLINGCPGLPCNKADYEIFAITLADGSERRLTADALADYDPYFSPDGRVIAWLTTFDPTANGGVGRWGIRVMNADGTGRRTLIDDGQINSKPAWSRDGASVFFHRMVPLRAIRWGVWMIRADGTGLVELTAGAPGNNEFPAAR